MKKLAQLTLVLTTLVSSFAFAETTTELMIGASSAKVTLNSESATPIRAMITSLEGYTQTVSFSTLKFIDGVEVDLKRVNDYSLFNPKANELSVEFEVEYSIGEAFNYANCEVVFGTSEIDMMCTKK